MALKCLNISDPGIKKLLKTVKSEVTLSKIIDSFGDKTPTDREILDKYVKLRKESPFTKQELFFERRIKVLEGKLKATTAGTEKYLNLEEEIKTLKEDFDSVRSSQSREGYLQLGTQVLNRVEEFINELENGSARDTAKNIEHSRDVLITWRDFTDLATKSGQLLERLAPFIDEFMLEEVNKYSTEEEPITQEMIDNQDEDIRTFKRGTGSLSDLANYIGRTIGSIIKAAQNRVETANKTLAKEIKAEVDSLNKYAESKGLTLDQVYKMLTQESKGTLTLAKEFYEDGMENENWTKIQKTPELKKFYDYYQKTIEEKQKALPIALGKYFIPNIRKEDLTDKLKKLSPVKTIKVGTDIEEEGIADVVPLKYHKPIPASEKSDNLGAVLYEFAKFSENYKEMSEILPTVRLLQEGLRAKVLLSGEIKERRFFKQGNPTVTYAGGKSNLYDMVSDIIEMQVKGKMKLEQGRVVIDDYYDENGDRKQKIIDGAELADNLLRYNSLVRIGLSPIGATTNFIFGNISNFVEAVGGQFINLSSLRQANNIFFNQTLTKGSMLNTLLTELNPLQELDDYHLGEDIKLTGKTNKLTPEKFTEIMYAPQKWGEKQLQSTTMLAVMIKEGYIDKNNQLTDKYKKATDEEKQKLIDKVQRLNQKIHGRYTTKESAAWSQNVAFRLISQFRKFIPAMVENRIGAKQWDNRLRADIEGSYLTFGRLVIKNWRDPALAFENLLLPLFAAQKLLESGKMTEAEIYNMRKMLIEITSISAMILLYALLHGGDDDEDKKFRKNPVVKTALTLLDRASGDLTFFYSPEQLNNLGKNAIPISKTVGDIIQAATVIPKTLYSGEYIIKKGSFKGQNRIFKEFADVIPLLNPASSTYSKLLTDNPLEEY